MPSLFPIYFMSMQLFIKCAALISRPPYELFTPPQGGRDLQFKNVGSVVEWLKYRTDDQHGLGSKPTRAILLCSWERHFTALSPSWWSWQAVLNYCNVSIKLLADINILASPEASWG